ncbi:hypothetical protein M3P05_12495 [Sansalvadorimonas sp. 2012CJ34-2]|uniref:Uncharacterized protein n=1 Tax=Parendozoicomonas callyspongiae TaxID=2942213 RepID=A0ABT0PHD3_9GAMM|nr:hypothetical protein [Sansalvadorimonas sp. 2012CJ34-2]MCL6270743.1 hypothetical protein [Sansalvadorimonas sp. 2012CJ34-2]
MKILILVFLGLFASITRAEYITDQAKISNIFINKDDVVLVVLGGEGFKNSQARFKCADKAKTWGRLANSKGNMLSAIYFASALEKEILFHVDGCIGNRFRINEIYIPVN